MVSVILLATSVSWIYFYRFFRASLMQSCIEQTVNFTTTLGKGPLQHMAPQAQIDRCLGKIGSKINGTLAWGVLHAIFAYLAAIVVVWGLDYRKRLLEIRECEESRSVSCNGGYDKVGLLLGTAPVGRSSSSRIIGSSKSAFGRRRDSEDDTRPLSASTVGERNGTEIIVRMSGTAASYKNKGENRTRSIASSISDVSSMGPDISVEGQSFVTTSR